MAMSLRRSRFKAIDQRSGRLERAVILTEDGETGMLVRKGDRDKPHPLSKPFQPPIDRAVLLGKTEPERQPGTTVIDVGYESPGSNYERPSMGVLTIQQTGGTITYNVNDIGYGEDGYGSFGYGGFSVIGEEAYW